jgi:hypothetical protein
MKTIIKITTVFLLIGLPLLGKSQFKASMGAEVTSALGDFSELVSYGFGLSAGGEYNFTDKFGITGQIGFVYLIPEKRYASAYMMPMQGGLKFYFESKDNGPYMLPFIGAHKLSVTPNDYFIQGKTINGITVTKTDVSYGFGIGYLTTAKFDICLRYNMVSDGNGNTSSYFGLRLAREFGN